MTQFLASWSDFSRDPEDHNMFFTYIYAIQTRHNRVVAMLKRDNDVKNSVTPEIVS